MGTTAKAGGPREILIRGQRRLLRTGPSDTARNIAHEFEDLVLDARQKNRIADFTGEHWPARLDDLIAIRSAAHPVIRQRREFPAIPCGF